MLSLKNAWLRNLVLDIKNRPRLVALYQNRQIAIRPCLLAHTENNSLVRCQESTLENTAFTNSKISYKDKLNTGPGLEFFIANSDKPKLGVKERHKIRKTSSDDHPYLTEETLRGDGQQGKFAFMHSVLLILSYTYTVPDF